MKKKGFTLVELLAVIAILAILVIIAIPNVLNLYRNARENVFLDDAQSVLRAAGQQYLQDSMSDKPVECYSSASTDHKLDLDAKSSLVYYVGFTNGKVTTLQVADGNYRIEATGTEIKVDQLRNSKATGSDIHKVTSSTDKSITDCPAS